MNSPWRSRFAGAVVAVALAGVVASGTASTAAATGSSTADGKDGQRLTISQGTGLDPAGQRVSVSGTGYPTYKGVYVAICKVPSDGGLPTPCGGGADMSGASQTSQWISSNPPSYGKGLAVPYAKDGSFEATIWAAPTLPDGQDCRQVACALVTRADHTRTSDRSQDVLIPVSFAAAESGGVPVPYVIGGAVLGVVLIAALVVVGLRTRVRRRDRRRGEVAAAEPEPAA